MIAYLRGVLMEKGTDHVIVETGGVGYEVHIAPATAARLPDQGETVELFLAESVGMYGGGTTLYGFATRDEKQMFLAFKALPATGAKKADIRHAQLALQALPLDQREAIVEAENN